MEKCIADLNSELRNAGIFCNPFAAEKFADAGADTVSISGACEWVPETNCSAVLEEREWLFSEATVEVAFRNVHNCNARKKRK
jgi:hypothetical protein